MYLITEFQRLKEDETNRLNLEWNLQRTLAKINYRIPTYAIKENLIPPELSKSQTNLVYSSEAGLLNMVLFDAGGAGNGAMKIRMKKEISEISRQSNNWSFCRDRTSINAVLIQQDLPQSTRVETA